MLLFPQEVVGHDVVDLTAEEPESLDIETFVLDCIIDRVVKPDPDGPTSSAVAKKVKWEP